MKLKASGIGPNTRKASEYAWQLIDQRLAEGWQDKAIYTLIGMPRSTFQVARLRRAKRGHTWMWAYSQQIIKALTSADTPVEGRVPTLGTRRRIQALAAIGYSFHDVAKEAGVPPESVRYLATRDIRHVHAAKAARITEVYDRLSIQPKPLSNQTKGIITRAQQKQWVAPGYWDEDIDNPEAKPNFPDRMQYELNKDTKLERRMRVLRMLKEGGTHRGIASELKTYPRAVDRDIAWLRENGHL